MKLRLQPPIPFYGWQTDYKPSPPSSTLSFHLPPSSLSFHISPSSSSPSFSFPCPSSSNLSFHPSSVYSRLPLPLPFSFILFLFPLYPWPSYFSPLSSCPPPPLFPYIHVPLPPFVLSSIRINSIRMIFIA